MERPKVRFSQTSELTSKENNFEETNITNNQTKVKIKSIVPINLPVKILKNGKCILIRDRKNICESTGFENDMPTFSSGSFVSEVSYPLPTNGSGQLMAELRSETSSSENVTKSLHPSDEQIGNYDSCEIKNCTDRLRTIAVEDLVNKTNERICTNLNNIFTEAGKPRVTCNSNEDRDVEVIQVINTSKEKRIKKSCLESNIAVRHNYKTQLNVKNKLAIQSKTITQSKLNGIPKTYDKENYPCNIQTDIKNELPTTINTATNVSKNRGNTNNQIFKNLTDSAVSSTCKITKEQRKLQVMPCAKFKITSSIKNKSSGRKLPQARVNKSTVFHVAGKYCNMSVQPGISSKKINGNTDDSKEVDNRKNIHSKELLSRPEYNSIICVMKKLKEIEKEKLITDVESLPTIYKNLVHGKVSTALDFAPYESVYKDLINLSVDDDELPVRLMRSKDPEPRNKDIAPELADFYNPKYTEQYFVILNPPVLNPDNVNIFSAFSISNKICTWKICRDNC